MSSECPTCERIFKNERGVKQHHARTHGESLVKIDVGCENCSTVFKRRKYRVARRERNFCSQECKSEWQSENVVGENSPTWEGGEIDTECNGCGEEISVRPVRFKESGNYCSVDCFNKEQRGFVDPYVECVWCGKEFKRKPSKRQENNFCSQECVGEYLSENFSGENSVHWKGGHTNLYFGIRQYLSDDPWRKVASDLRKNRGGCYQCGSPDNLHVHHIIPLRSGGTNGEWNLMVLCEECHTRTERYTEKIVETYIKE